MKERFDVVIVGAGPSGSALACWLARRGFAVAPLERTEFGVPRVGESLSPAVRPLLTELDVWDAFTRLGPLPSNGTRSVWGSDEINEHSHVVSPYGCGWHIERRSFDRMLADAAADAGADLRCGTVVVGCEQQRDGGWIVSLEAPSGRGTWRLRAAMLVDATGRFAHAARRLGAKRLSFDRLIAAATLFTGVDVASEGYVLVETTQDGWWYSAPVPPDGLMVMLMTDSDLASSRASRLADRWRRSLTRAPVTTRRRRGTQAWGPRTFSAQSHRLRRADMDNRWLAVGDAGLAVDPVSGNGVVRALRSASAAAETIVATLEGPPSNTIATYEARRDDECTSYLHERLSYYAIEERWSNSPFWSRRLQVAASMIRAGRNAVPIHG